MMDRNLPFARFICAVYALIDIQVSSNFFLHEIMILAQIAQSSVIHLCPPPFLLKVYFIQEKSP